MKSCMLGSSLAITPRPLSRPINFVHRLITFVALGVWLGRLSLKSNVAIRTLALALVAA
jgi:hypothetical protein